MEIVLGIFGVLLAIGLAITLLKFAFYLIVWIAMILWKLFKLSLYLIIPALGILAVYYLYEFMGLWLIAILAGLFLIALFVKKKETLEDRVKAIFYDVEMASFTELTEKLSSGAAFNRNKLYEVIQQYLASGKLEELEFGDKEVIYRWTEKRNYPNGVITQHIQLD